MGLIENEIRDWVDSRRALPFYPSMTFDTCGLALGRRTTMARFTRGMSASQGLDLEGQETRILALLAAAQDRQVSSRAIESIRRASEIWQTGDKALAQIRLAYIGLPAIDEKGVYRLHLAADLLDKGLSPLLLLKELGFSSSLRALEKYSPDQPRVPAGSGRERALDIGKCRKREHKYGDGPN